MASLTPSLKHLVRQMLVYQDSPVSLFDAERLWIFSNTKLLLLSGQVLAGGAALPTVGETPSHCVY